MASHLRAWRQMSGKRSAAMKYITGQNRLDWRIVDLHGNRRRRIKTSQRRKLGDGRHSMKLSRGGVWVQRAPRREASAI